MKKLSTILALALIVTIGSVYAAWNYSKGPAASSEITREINMAQVNTDSNKGSITVTPHDVVFLVDNKGEFVADLVGTDGGYFEVNFTPAPGADEIAQTQGIEMVATVTVQVSGTTNTKFEYEGKQVTPVKAKDTNTILLNDGDAATETTLTVQQILSVLDFCVDESDNDALVEVRLPTKLANDTFHNVLKNYTIVITISEVVTTP